MTRAQPLKKLRTMIPSRGGRDNLSGRVRRTLVTSLYDQPSSFALGAVTGVSSTAVAAWISGSQLLAGALIILVMITVGRIISAQLLCKKREESSTNRLELSYVVGALAYALAMGAIAATTILYPTEAAVEVLLVTLSLIHI